MSEYPVSKIMHFDANTRLMCPNCCTVSSKHKVHSPRYEHYWDTSFAARFVFLHTCHRCGYTDDTGSGFTDSGNDDRDEFKDLYDRAEQLDKEQSELDAKKYQLQEDQKLYERVWQSDDDYNG